MDIGMIFLFICVGATLALFGFNFYHTWKYGKSVRSVSIALFVVAVIAVLFNMYQLHMAQKDDTLMVANGIALLCILISAKRSLKR